MRNISLVSIFLSLFFFYSLQLSHFSGIVDEKKTGTFTKGYGTDGDSCGFRKTSVNSNVPLMYQVYIPLSQVSGNEIKGINI